jgi:16S rRNA (cytosine1407-C5)-methyltransferase
MSRKPRSFRLACGAGEVPLVEALLAAEDFAFAPEPFYAKARGLTAEPRPLGDSLAAAFGLIYIQDRSSMLPPLILDPPPGAKVLDMCASPGGKTSLLSEAVGREGFVLGNEPSRDRLATLRANLRRLCAANAATCSYPGEELPLPAGSFDRILLDPPCSGWGTAEKNPKVLAIWQGDKVAPLITLQRRLLAHAARLLAPDGEVVYSTCTTNPRENAEQVAWARDELGLVPEPLAPPPGFVADPAGAGLGLAVDGRASGAQGFFLARLRAPAGPVPHTPEGEFSPPGRPVEARDLESPEDTPLAWDNLPRGRLYDFAGRLVLLPTPALSLPQGLRFQGFPLGRVSGRRFRPDPRLRTLLPAFAPGLGLNLETPAELSALLSGQSLPRPAGCAGHGLYFRGLALGFLVAKGRRLLWSDR